MVSNKQQFDVIIIGGSYAGLSAAMSLGRSMRKVLVVDSGLPCNRPTPHSHNFITHDGAAPAAIAGKALEQVLQYATVTFHKGIAVSGAKMDTGFEIITASGDAFLTKKIIFATGIKDLMPDIKGFSDCWGVSVIHCPYCHGYEVRNERTGILANGDIAFHYAPLVHNLTKDLTIFTNGASTMTPEQTSKINRHGIAIVEKEVAFLEQECGRLRQVVFKDGSTFDLKALYARPDFEQHCTIPVSLGCALTAQGFLQVDLFQQTTVSNIFACGDNSSPLRAVAAAVASGNMAGAMVNRILAEEAF